MASAEDRPAAERQPATPQPERKPTTTGQRARASKARLEATGQPAEGLKDQEQAATPQPGQTETAPEQGAGQLATQRAEEVLDRLGQQVGQWAALAGFRLLQASARAREEAEDIWAEAQSIRRRPQP